MCIFYVSIEYHPKAENIQKAKFIYTEYECTVSINPKQHKSLSSSHLVPRMEIILCPPPHTVLLSLVMSCLV